MSFPLFKTTLDEIVTDLGGAFRRAVAEEAAPMVRAAISKRRDGYLPDLFTFWTETEDEDFVGATAELKAMFSETTGERALGFAEQRGGRLVHRPSAIWLEGRKYRARVARLWSYEPYPGADLKWAAEVTQFGRACIGAPGYLGPKERSRYERDVPSEHLAEKAMKDLFEERWRVDLVPA